MMFETTHRLPRMSFIFMVQLQTVPESGSTDDLTSYFLPSQDIPL